MQKEIKNLTRAINLVWKRYDVEDSRSVKALQMNIVDHLEKQVCALLRDQPLAKTAKR